MVYYERWTTVGAAGPEMTRDRGNQHHHQRRKFAVPQSAVDSNEEDDPEEKFPSERKSKGKYKPHKAIGEDLTEITWRTQKLHHRGSNTRCDADDEEETQPHVTEHHGDIY